MTAEYIHSYQERPLQYKVLCVMAFIFGGITLVFSLFFLILGGIQNDLLEFMRPGILPPNLVQVAGLIYSIVAFILSVTAFVGLIQMWNRVEVGYWIFSISMLLFLVLPFIFLKVPFLWLFKTLSPFVVITGIFILLFYHNRRFME
ncbi:MAG: hypothetical protein V2I46_08615 [Bacteroides sp.]|jgi:hypothetical protein|nr:hypothetical protein [Bacteroides sp.]